MPLARAASAASPAGWADATAVPLLMAVDRPGPVEATATELLGLLGPPDGTNAKGGVSVAGSTCEAAGATLGERALGALGWGGQSSRTEQTSSPTTIRLRPRRPMGRRPSRPARLSRLSQPRIIRRLAPSLKASKRADRRVDRAVGA